MPARVVLGAGVGPGVAGPQQVGPPGEEHTVELEALGAELGDALAQVSAGAMAVVAVAVPGAEAHDLGGLVVVGDAPLGEDLVAGGGDETVAGGGSLRVALVEVAQLPLVSGDDWLRVLARVPR